MTARTPYDIAWNGPWSCRLTNDEKRALCSEIIAAEAAARREARSRQPTNTVPWRGGFVAGDPPEKGR